MLFLISFALVYYTTLCIVRLYLFEISITNLGYDTQGAEGKFGNNTLAAVKAFQGISALTADGYFGKNSFGADILVHRERLVGSSTDDQQQLIISGQEIDLGTVNEGQADDSLTQPQEITTTNLDEAVKVLGFTPALPQWIPDGWELLSYDASRTGSAKWFDALYTRAGQEYDLLYQIGFFDDAERASLAFEQNKIGIEYTLADGRTVYMSKNYDDTTCVWYEDLSCYSLSGPENSDTLIRIVENIKETPSNASK